jgi:penicillin-binding protein 2
MSKIRMLTVLAGMWVLLIGLSVRLVFLQLIHQEHYNTKAEKRRRKIEYLPARRGRILDCENRVLAIDQPRYELCVDLTELDPALDLVARLARSLGQSRKELIRQIALARKQKARSNSYALVSGPVSAAKKDRMGRLILKQKRIFRHAHRLSGLNEDQPVLKWIRGHGVAIAMPVLTVRDRTLNRLAELTNTQAAPLAALVEIKVNSILAEDNVHKRLEEWSSAFVIDKELKFSMALAVEERLFELPGILIRKKFERHYPFGESASHLIGYVGAMSSKAYKKLVRNGLIINVPRWYYKRITEATPTESLTYPPEQLLLGTRRSISRGSRLHSDFIGRTALELSNDGLLAGIPGARVIERDYKNHQLGILAEIPEQHGQDLRITIDIELQKITELALDEAIKTKATLDSGAGAAVMNVHDGRLLVLASAPRFDLNRFNEIFRKLNSNPRKPLFNRSTAAMPPGSTYKVLSALAFFDRRMATGLSMNTHFSCSGQLFPKGNRFKCDGVHGHTGLVRAIQHSCNVFFWRGVHKAGYQNTLVWAQILGFGQRITDGVPGENRGQVPDKNMKEPRYRLALKSYERWKQRYEVLVRLKEDDAEIDLARRHLIRSEDWYRRCKNDRRFNDGNKRNAVIGQGDVLASPIQIARLTAFVANGGFVVKPRIHLSTPIQKKAYPVNGSLLRAIQKGLREVVLHGTASRSSIGLRRLDVAGKTGTAERKKGQPNYAWFMGYYPASKPEIAFAVVIDKTKGHGGDVAGPVARKIVEAYMRGRPRR